MLKTQEETNDSKQNPGTKISSNEIENSTVSSVEISGQNASFESKFSEIKSNISNSSELPKDETSFESKTSEIRQNESELKNENSEKNEETSFSSTEGSKIVETGNQGIEQAVNDFGKSSENKEENGNYSTFGVTEPHEVQITQLVISQTQPTMEKEGDELIISPDPQTETMITDTSTKDEILSTRTLNFTVNSLLDSIINEGKQEKMKQQNDQKGKSKTAREISQLSFDKKNANSNKTMDSPVSERKKEEILKRKMRQEEAATRLSKPKPKPVILEDTKTPRRTLSKLEQKEAAERLSKTKTVVRDFNPQTSENELKTKKKKVNVRQVPSEHLVHGISNVKETQTEGNATTRPQKATKEFKEFIEGKPKPKQTAYTRELLTSRSREIESVKTRQEISEIADKIINTKNKGKIQEIDDPATIADVVNEITNRRIAALNESNYIESMKLQKIAEDIRKQFRIRDREHYHEDYMRDLKRKLDAAKTAYKEAEEQWNNKIKDLKEEQKAEIESLEYKHESEMQELEEKWQRPEAARKFTKKSPQLLSQQTIEKHMALTGDLVGAYQMSKVVRKNEKIEATQRFEDMKLTFEKSRANLMDQQQQARGLMEHLHELKRMEYNNKKDEIITQHKKRIQVLEKIIADDADIEKFFARKFRKPADVVVPMTVTTAGGDDIPSNGKLRAAPLNTAGIMSFRENTAPSPLQLPTLKIQRPKTARKQKTSRADEI